MKPRRLKKERNIWIADPRVLFTTNDESNKKVERMYYPLLGRWINYKTVDDEYHYTITGFIWKQKIIKEVDSNDKIYTTYPVSDYNCKYSGCRYIADRTNGDSKRIIWYSADDDIFELDVPNTHIQKFKNFISRHHKHPRLMDILHGVRTIYDSGNIPDYNQIARQEKIRYKYALEQAYNNTT